MTLTSRLSISFLLLLALVELSFATGLYTVVRRHMRKEASARVNAAMAILSGMVEESGEGLEWEREGRAWSLDSPLLQDELLWRITDSRGQVIEQCNSPMLDDSMVRRLNALAPGSQPQYIKSSSENWLASRRQFVSKAAGIRSANPIQEEDQEEHAYYSELNATAALSTARIMADLQRFALVLAGISTAVWLLALGLCRYACRRALAPLHAMVEAAKAVEVATLDNQRLPTPSSGDELAEMAGVFNAVLDRLQESFERQRRFAGDASHQLRTPLTALIGHIEVALRHERDAGEYRDVLLRTHKKALQLGRIVESLLFLSRSEAEAVQPQSESLNVAEWLAESMHRWSHHERYNDLRLELKVSNCCVTAPPELLSQLCDILVDNALKYSEAGTPVVIALTAHNGVLQLQVTNRGFGISPSELQHLFRPFFRASEAHRRGIDGVGLGLSIAKRLAESFGASISVQSDPGSETTFTISFAD